jgi:hypothetical protein
MNRSAFLKTVLAIVAAPFVVKAMNSKPIDNRIWITSRSGKYLPKEVVTLEWNGRSIVRCKPTEVCWVVEGDTFDLTAESLSAGERYI